MCGLRRPPWAPMGALASPRASQQPAGMPSSASRPMGGVWARAPETGSKTFSIGSLMFTSLNDILVSWQTYYENKYVRTQSLALQTRPGELLRGWAGQDGRPLEGRSRN